MATGGNRKERHIPYGIESSHALSVLGSHLFPDPNFFVRELISNAIDASVGASSENSSSVEVTIEEGRSLTIRDYGCGMSESTMEEVLPVFFKSTKTDCDPLQIGEFGIGLYASLRYAKRVEVYSKRCDENSATVAVFGPSGVTLGTTERMDDGTEVKVYVAPDAPLSATDSIKLHMFICSVFPFSPVDIYVNAKPVAGPNCFDLPWEDSVRSDGWTPFPVSETPDFPHPEVVHVIRRTHALADFALFLTKGIIPPEQRSIQLFVKRVQVAPNYTPQQNKIIGTFLSGAVNARNVRLTVTRDAVIKEDNSVRTLDRLFFEVLGDGLQQMARERPRAFRHFVDEHREQFLMACSQSEDLLRRVHEFVTFKTSKGEWCPLGIVRKGRSAYYADSPEQLDALSARARKKHVVFLFASEAEHAFLSRLLAGSIPRVSWKRIDELALTRRRSKHYFHAQQVEAALRELVQSTSEPDLVSSRLSPALKVVRAKITEVQVLSAPKERRAAWLIPRFKRGVDKELARKEAREKVKREGEYQESSCYFSSAVKRTANEDNCDKILALNYDQPLIQEFFKILGSARPCDQQLSGFLLGSLLGIARNHSSEDWILWTEDLIDNARQLTNLATIIVAQHARQCEQRGAVTHESI